MATALVDMRGTTSPRLVLELACARVLLPGAAQDVTALLARLDNLERRIAAGVVAAAPAAPAPPVAPTPAAETKEPAAPVVPEEVAQPVADAEPEPAIVTEPAAADPEPATPTPPVSTGTLDLAGLRRLWDSVLDAVKQRSRTAHALMLSSQIESLDDRTLTLSFKTPTLATRFANDVADFVTEALTEVLGIEVKVKAVSGEGGTPPASAPEAAAPTRSAATPVHEPEPEPDEIDISDDADGAAVVDPSDAALALVKEGLGAQVIGEIDGS
jgi:DNA polymerase-3 subunit gamma/tau